MKFPYEPHGFSFDRLTHVTHFREFKSILSDNPHSEEAIFRGKRKGRSDWKFMNRDDVEYNYCDDLEDLYNMELVWFSPMPDSPLGSNGPPSSRVPQAAGGVSRYGEFSLSFEREHFFDEYRRHIGQPFVIYELPSEAYQAECTETYLVCPHFVRLDFDKRPKRTLRFFHLPTLHMFLEGRPGHAWKNVQFCFAVQGEFQVMDPEIDFVDHDVMLQPYWMGGYTRHPVCIPYKHDMQQCQALTRFEAEEQYDEMEEEYARELARQRYRTSPCRYFRAGNCWSGNQCTYRHDYAGNKRNCRFYYSGQLRCKYDIHCRNRHAEPRWED